jgi:hypothetical protein
MATGTVSPSSLQIASTWVAKFQKFTAQYAPAPPSDLAISTMMAASARWAALSAPRITKWFLPLAAMVMAFPLAVTARSITFPLTIRALELGNRLTTLGGLPIRSAFSKSAFLMEDMGTPLEIDY